MMITGVSDENVTSRRVAAMALNDGTDWSKTIGLIAVAAFVLWFLYEGFKLVGRFMEKY